jgi:hypothetical protein
MSGAGEGKAGQVRVWVGRWSVDGECRQGQTGGGCLAQR